MMQALKKWRHYLVPMKFVLYTNNIALQLITKHEKINQIHVKWVEFMKIFTFVLKHISEQTKKVAHALSRIYSVLHDWHVHIFWF